MDDDTHKANHEAALSPPRPGETITPSDAQPVVEVVEPQPQAEDPQAPPPPPPTVEVENTEALKFQAEPEVAEPQTDPEATQLFSWKAPEFIAHDKSPMWYIGLMLGTIVLAGLLYILTKSPVTVAVVIISGIILAIYGSHRPKEVGYSLDASTITIGNRQFRYEDFLSFYVTQEGVLSDVTLMPHRRFAPPTGLYYHPDDEEKIVGILSERLPMQPRRLDMTDSLMRRLHF